MNKIEQILSYLRINCDQTDTVLYTMLKELQDEAYNDGYDDGVYAGSDGAGV